MNGCQGDDHDPTAPIGTIETRTFPAVSTPALAVESLNAAIADMQSQPSAFDSGIIRLEVGSYFNKLHKSSLIFLRVINKKKAPLMQLFYRKTPFGVIIL